MNAPAPTIDFEKYVGQYVKLRDKIKELDDAHKEVMKPYRETLEQLNGVLLNHLNSINSDSTATAAGTVYRSTKKSASLADAEAFWTFVITQGAFELVDKRANVTAVADYIEANKAPPPGVNFTTHHVVGVRRK